MLNPDTIHERLQQRGALDTDKVSPAMLEIAGLLEMVANVTGCLSSGLLDVYEEERLSMAVSQAKETLADALRLDETC